MENNLENFIQSNSPDGALKHTLQSKDFLQSVEWRKFQESVGRKTFNITGENFNASIIEHQLPIVGKYFYVPRGPVIPAEAGIQNNNMDSGSMAGMTQLVNLAKENKAGWIRIEPANEEILKIIKKNVGARFIEPETGGFNKLNPYKNYKIVRSPHNMQPKEILILDITKSGEELLAEMKPKTRYNIRLAQKHGVSVFVIPAEAGIQSAGLDSGSEAGMTNKYIDEFIRLIKITAERDGITPHPDNYYRKMFEAIPGDILKLYVAEYEGNVIAANLIIFFGKTATYLHGASDNGHRNLMAPYLLQWQGIQDAKAAGCMRYDFGGINTKTGEGITKFKTGFAPNTKSVEFPGSYDMIINPVRYWMYRIMQVIKSLF